MLFISTELKQGNKPWNKGKKTGQVPWNKGKKFSEEQKSKISVATKNAMQNIFIREKIFRTQFKKGRAPWNKHLRGYKIKRSKKLTKEQKKKISEATKKALSCYNIREKMKATQFKKGCRPWNKGKVTGQIPWNKGKKGVYSEETLCKIRLKRLKQIYPKKNTGIEKILFRILEETNISFQKHMKIKMICQADAFVEPNLVLFADGDYWHCNPIFFEKRRNSKMSEAQIKNAKRDEEQNRKLIKEGYIVLRFWEHDLINNVEKCKEQIKKVITWH